MDYAKALRELLKEYPSLKGEAQRIFFEGAADLNDIEHPSIKMNSYERIYKAVKAIADKQTSKALHYPIQKMRLDS